MIAKASEPRPESIYRSALELPERDEERIPTTADPDLCGLCFLWWVASVVRVAVPLAGHEGFDGEGALAAVVIVLLPWMLRTTLAATVRRVARRVGVILEPRASKRAGCGTDS